MTVHQYPRGTSDRAGLRAYRLPGSLAVLALCLSSPPSFAKSKGTFLKPSSDWLVDWSEHTCLLARSFGTGADAVLLNMRTYHPGYSFEVTVAGNNLAAYQKAPVLGIAYGSGRPMDIRFHQNGRNENYGPAITFSSEMGPDGNDVHGDDIGGETASVYPDTAFEAQLNRITLSTREKQVTLNTGPMPGALTALRQCTDNLMEKWGLDPKVQASLTREARPTNRASWASKIQTTFPSEAQIRAKDARVSVLVIVDEKGQPSDCDAWQTFSNTNFKIRACGIILRQARFEPALDKDGRPASSYYSTAIIYRSY